MQSLGIPVALAGSVFLALGAQFQHRGVSQVDSNRLPTDRAGLSIRQLLALLHDPFWVLGTVMLALAIAFQLFSLYLAPLTVVQPLGVVGLVITAVVNSRVTRTALGPPAIRAIAFCVVGVALFVTTATLTTSSRPVRDSQLVTVLVILGCVLLLLALIFVLFRTKFTAFFYIVGAGILFGFVATLAKVVIDRVHTIIVSQTLGAGFHLMPGDWLTIVCAVGIIVASLCGTYFVQTAYASGPPDLVVAGLTVIDPIVGVTIGIVVLDEAASAPLWAALVFVVAGALAIYGVFQLAKHHPQMAH
ncbi:MAG: multidrug DMT transporter permease [Microbacteriaceae bacterium]|nr:MAG: multidrug DMT transporter permease [Microbacteriaceae bacterium]